jgi:hypothetical protein
MQLEILDVKKRNGAELAININVPLPWRPAAFFAHFAHAAWAVVHTTKVTLMRRHPQQPESFCESVQILIR